MMQWKRRKKLEPHCRQCPFEDDRFATCGLPMIDIDLLGSSEEEWQRLTQRPEETAAEYRMEISSERSKILVKSIKPRPSTNIQMNGQTIEEVHQFKYLSSTQTKDGTSVKEVKIRLAQANSAMTRLVILRKNKATRCVAVA